MSQRNSLTLCHMAPWKKILNTKILFEKAINKCTTFASAFPVTTSDNCVPDYCLFILSSIRALKQYF